MAAKRSGIPSVVYILLTSFSRQQLRQMSHPKTVEVAKFYKGEGRFSLCLLATLLAMPI